MKVVVDTNIVFSAMLNSQGKIGQLLVLGSRHFEYFTIGLLHQEILKHRDKLLKLSGYPEEHIDRVFQIITSRIKFVDDVLLSERSIQEAKALVSKIDEDDALFLALCSQIDAKLWTGTSD